jgi:hypothetical protein
LRKAKCQSAAADLGAVGSPPDRSAGRDAVEENNTRDNGSTLSGERQSRSSAAPSGRKGESSDPQQLEETPRPKKTWEEKEREMRRQRTREEVRL